MYLYVTQIPPRRRFGWYIPDREQVWVVFLILLLYSHYKVAPRPSLRLRVIAITQSLYVNLAF